MKTQPFFSIVIPTRGRPELLRDALVSTLRQDFDDFEVVVSDNYNDNQTQAVIDEFIGDQHLRCLRTGRLLNMPNHFDFAAQHARGQYVLFLTDRSVLKQGALTIIHAAISASDKPVELCSWRWSVYNDVVGREDSNKPVFHEVDILRLSSIQILEDFASGVNQYYKCLPRGINSCYKNSFMQQMRDRFGTPFKPISPDYRLAFACLALAQEVLFIDRNLFISQGVGVSNGTNAFIGKGNAVENYLKTLGDIDFYAHVPIKSPTCYNLIFEDFFTVQETFGNNLGKIACDWSGYFAYCYSELLSKKAWGQMSPNALQNLFDEWERALSTFDQATQNEAKEKIGKLPQPAPPPPQQLNSDRNIGANSCIDRTKRLIYRLIRPDIYVEKEGAISREKKQGISALELAGF